MLGSVGFTRKTRGRPHYIIRKDNDIPSGTGDICVQVGSISLHNKQVKGKLFIMTHH